MFVDTVELLGKYAEVKAEQRVKEEEEDRNELCSQPGVVTDGEYMYNLYTLL